MIIKQNSNLKHYQSNQTISNTTNSLSKITKNLSKNIPLYSNLPITNYYNSYLLSNPKSLYFQTKNQPHSLKQTSKITIQKQISPKHPDYHNYSFSNLLPLQYHKSRREAKSTQNQHLDKRHQNFKKIAYNNQIYQFSPKSIYTKQLIPKICLKNIQNQTLNFLSSKNSSNSGTITQRIVKYKQKQADINILKNQNACLKSLSENLLKQNKNLKRRLNQNVNKYQKIIKQLKRRNEELKQKLVYRNSTKKNGMGRKEILIGAIEQYFKKVQGQQQLKQRQRELTDRRFVFERSNNKMKKTRKKSMNKKCHKNGEISDKHLRYERSNRKKKIFPHYNQFISEVNFTTLDSQNISYLQIQSFCKNKINI